MQPANAASLPPSQQVLYRILDANLDRAREGLRILEEWGRFGLEDADLTAQFKHMRQTLGHWHRTEFRLARNTPDDPGTALTHPQEAQRDSITTLLQANFSRVQEALRALEEYGKLEYGKPGYGELGTAHLAADCKQLRYQLYTLESQVLGYPLRQQLHRAQTYLVTAPHEALLGVVEAALKGGIEIVQHREKTADDETRLQVARQLRALCHRYGALFIVNDRVDIALAANADGVHLGQQDVPMAVARTVLGPHKIVGRSTTNPDELARALAENADYVGVGPFFETPTKPGKAASGPDYVRYALDHATMPFFVIGGVNLENLATVTQAGATRVALVRAIMQAENPTLASQQLVQQMRAIPTQQSHSVGHPA
ncbi:MAG: thiamine phosphate synthase [Cyanobacteria bacterium P01_A01_bin.105]